MQFRNPLFLLLFALWLPLLWVYFKREKKRPAVRYSDLSILKALPKSRSIVFRHIPIALRLLGIGLIVIALARPQKGTSEEEVTTEGVDIMLVLDVSYSMKALDFQPKNRLFVAKETIKEFIKKRRSDRIGLVVFAKRSFTKCPLTLDYNVLTQFVDGVDFEEFSDQTAIGVALATAGNRIKESHAKSRVIVLLTDGANNAGEIAPLAAASAVGELGIKTYTIGVGKEGDVPYPVEVIDRFTGKVIGTQIQVGRSEVDEQLLSDIAHVTGGKFFRAQNTEQLKEIYATIDKMEKTQIKTKLYTSYADYFFPWVVMGVLVLLLETIISQTWLRRIP
jgi:Ca-activated chloride channel family protein